MSPQRSPSKSKMILGANHVEETSMVDKWLEEIKQNADSEKLGMILIHNGIVRSTSKSGNPVRAMKLSYDQKRLDSVVPIFKQRPGVLEVKVWINSGALNVGDNIMFLLVAGRFKTDVLPTFEELLSLIKSEIVTEEEV